MISSLCLQQCIDCVLNFPLNEQEMSGSGTAVSPSEPESLEYSPFC